LTAGVLFALGRRCRFRCLCIGVLATGPIQCYMGLDAQTACRRRRICNELLRRVFPHLYLSTGYAPFKMPGMGTRPIFVDSRPTTCGSAALVMLRT
jgi:hypothetical protein